MTDWAAQFDSFVARKTQQAIDAPLPPYVTGMDRGAGELPAIGNDWSMRLFDGPFYVSAPGDARPSCSLVFVQSADGNTVAPNPATLGGGETDKHLIYEGLSRVAADAVLSGAETLRGGTLVLSVWHPELVDLRAALGLPRHPVQIVATLRGMDIGGALLFNVPHIPVVVVTVPSVAAQMNAALAARPWITPLVMNRPGDLPDAFERLRRMGIGRLSCIGGRTLAAQLLDAGLVDDVYLTTGPRPGGEPNTPLHAGPWRGPVLVRKHGSGVEEGVVFEHVVPARQA